MSTKKDKIQNSDNFFMSLALDLARSKHGLTGTNPSVGCVIVKNNKIISIGSTGYNGRPHAERNAINFATEDVQDSTMYVTLEPCVHYGKTPPCTNLIIKKKIKKVVFGIDDIDKKVRSKSLKILKKKKIIVKKNNLNNQINEFYNPYKFNRLNKLPYVTGKIAISKNNIFYSPNVKKITNKQTEKFTHYLRYKNDGIIVTSKTLNNDNPKLNCRLKGLGKFSPIRIILDRNINTDKKSYIFKTSNSKNTILFFNKDQNKNLSVFKKKGIRLYKTKIDKNNLLDLNWILKKLYSLGLRNILVETGNELSKSFIKDKLFNNFYLLQSPNYIPLSIGSKLFKNYAYLKKIYKNKTKVNDGYNKDQIELYRRN